MTRIMYDGITASALPAGAAMVAGYVDGTWPDYPTLVVKFPHAVHVPIAVSAAADAGLVLDVENGDATPEDAVNWVLARRAAGVDPTVYCSASTWPTVRAAFATHDVRPPYYWIAAYDDDPAIPSGAIAHQYVSTAGWDESSVADYWPGVDPAPAPAPAPTAPTEETDDMGIILYREAGTTNCYIRHASGQFTHVPDGESVDGYVAAKVPQVTVSAAEIAAIQAAGAVPKPTA
jgi:hypothetical protein